MYQSIIPITAPLMSDLEYTKSLFLIANSSQNKNVNNYCLDICKSLNKNKLISLSYGGLNFNGYSTINQKKLVIN